MKFVIFHGSFGTANGNWFPDLKAKLEYMDQEVYAPQFPIDDIDSIEKESDKTGQNLKAWFQTFENEVLPHLQNTDEKICFIGHSLGNVFILHVLEKYNIQLDAAIFVSPCLDRLTLVPWYYDKVNTTFYKTDFDFEELKNLVPVSYVLYSENDPYIEPRRALHFAKVLDSSHIMVREAGHLNAEVQLMEFPLVFDLCMTRIDLSLYQKYAYKRQVEDSVKSLKNPENKVLKMTPEQIMDEGTFHYMNLQKSGFATFITSANDCDPKGEYYRGSRDKAKKGIPITRVFVVKDRKDLEKPRLIEQINLDIKSGIDVRLVDNGVIEKIGCEEDFGIWDNEYVCTLHFSDDGHISEGIIDGTLKTITTAQNWRDRILRGSIKLERMEDLNKFKGN